MGNRNGVWLTRTVRRKTARKDGTEAWDRSYLEMIVGEIEDDAKMDGERLTGEAVMMDEDYKEKVYVHGGTCSGAESVHDT